MMTDKTATQKALSVLAAFPIDRPRIIGRPDTGILNEAFVVADRFGHKFLLRGYLLSRDPARVSFQLEFQEHLRRNGFPVAPNFASCQGEQFVTRNGIPWVLFQFVDGSEYDYARIEQAREAGRRLAQFHDLGARFTGEPAAGFEDFGRRFFLSALDYERDLRGLFPNEGQVNEIVFCSERWQAFTETWPRGRLEALPASWLHIDYTGRNMLFEGDRMTALFDFDDLTRGPRALDIGSGILNFGNARWGFCQEVRADFVRAFLDGYQSVSPITADEWQAAPALVAIRWAPYSEMVVKRDATPMRCIQAEMRRLAPEFGWDLP